MASEYCTKADLFEAGLSSSLPNPARKIALVDVTTNRLTLDAHGLYDGIQLSFRGEAGATLPEPLVRGTQYTATDVDDNSFALAGVDITTAGVGGLMMITPIPYTWAIRWASGLIDEMLSGNVVPLTAPYPQQVVIATADLATWKLNARFGSNSRSLTDVYTQNQKLLEKWEKGAAVKGPDAPKKSQYAQHATATATLSDGRGWRRFGGC